MRPDLPNPLFVITDPTHLWVIVDLPERNLGAVQVGQDVAVEVDAYPERALSRRASRRSARCSIRRRGACRCAACVDNPKRLLKPEMYARVTLLAGTQDKLPRVPNSALITEGLYSFVFVEKEPGVFEKRQVDARPAGPQRTATSRRGLDRGRARRHRSARLLLNSRTRGLSSSLTGRHCTDA